MIETIRAYIDGLHLLVLDTPVVVGLSGGADSVALLSVLCELGYSCVAAHCNFHLRGEESGRDEIFCRELAGHFRIPFRKVDFGTEKVARERRISVEMAARELRYEWFEQVRVSEGAQAIAVGHHQNDSVETVIMNLCRGTGIRGLSGIHPKNGFVVRPLLTVTRDDILWWLKEKQLSYVTDSSNLSDDYQRNFIRLKVLPLLREINPAVDRTIARTAGHIAGAETIYLSAIEEARRNIFMNDYTLSIDKLLAYPVPEAILYEMLKPFGFTRLITEAIYRSLDKESGKTFYSPAYRLVKDRDTLQLALLEDSQPIEYALSPEEQNELDYPVRLLFRIETVGPSFVLRKDKNTACLDYDKLASPIVLRKWRKGDWFIPFGLNGKKKLSDYFSDRKYSLLEKEAVWLLCSGEDIVWVVGERIDQRYSINACTRKALIFHFFHE